MKTPLQLKISNQPWDWRNLLWFMMVLMTSLQVEARNQKRIQKTGLQGGTKTEILTSMRGTHEGADPPACGNCTIKTDFEPIYDIAVEGNSVYLATEFGVYISHDRGNTFSVKFPKDPGGQNVYLVWGVCAVGNTVYAATGEGVSISYDGGDTFAPGTNEIGRFPGQANKVAASGTNVYAATPDGLGISTDGGKTFGTFLLNQYVTNVFADGTNVYACALEQGVSISKDGGKTFSRKTTVNGLSSNSVTGLFAVGDTVYASTIAGLSISYDGGNNFTSTKTIANGLGSNYVIDIFVQGSTIYAATREGLSISTDGGNTFINKTTANGLAHNRVEAVGALSDRVFACTNPPEQFMGNLSICPASSPPHISLNVSDSSNPGSLTVVQNTNVTLTSTGCTSGTLTWSTSTTSGSGSTISVPTSNPGTLVYSATCTTGSCTSDPATFTVVVTPVVANGSFDGFLYGADCTSFRGWVWDRTKVNSVITVDILDGNTPIATILADEFRQDLLEAGKGNGKHAFRFTIPDRLKDGLPHRLSARVAGSSYFLINFPKTITCQPVIPPVNQAPVGPALIAELSAQVSVPFSSGALAVFTDPEGGRLTYSLSGLPHDLLFSTSSRVVNGMPAVPGSYTLVYTATDSQGGSTRMTIPLTVHPASTTTVTGNFEGFLDKVECGTIRGWVWDKNKPNTPVTVEIYTGNTSWGSTVAGIYRVDLQSAGKGNGAHAYSFDVPEGLKDGVSRLIQARVLGSTYALKWSNKPLTCLSGSRLSAEADQSLDVLILGNPVSSEALEVEVRGIAGQPLRLQLREVNGRLISEWLVEEARATERLTMPVSRESANLLLLHVTSGRQSVTLKVIKP